MAAVGIAAFAMLVLAAALAAPVVPRSNWVWDWHDVTSARAAIIFGMVSTLGAMGLAVSVWRKPSLGARRLLGAELALAAVTITSSLLLMRSGSWMPDMRAVMVCV